MVTGGTPIDKRLKRFEQGREEWKLKAMFRREEVIKLDIELKKRDHRLSKLTDQNYELQEQLTSANKKITEQEKLLKKLKKKSLNR